MSLYVLNNLRSSGCVRLKLRQDIEADLLDVYGSPAKARLKLRQTAIRNLMRDFMATQLDALAKDQARHAQVVAGLYRELKGEGGVDLIVRLKDEEPLTRWLAIEVAQNRWEPIEAFLIPLLEDAVPQVRQAAHQALVRLSRGNDFGPFVPNPTREQIRTAQKQWRAWLELQEAAP